MTEEIKKVLLKILDNDYEAYVVGGYIRDYILGKDSIDVDICTNALPKALINIFEEENIKVSSYGSIKLTTNKYNFDITTYRKELKYENGKPTQIEYIDNLDTDIKRRDFSINALYMDIDGNIIDRINGMKDLNDKIIKVIGDIDEKFEEDESRILRALRFKITLNFNLDSQIIEYIHLNKKEIKNISWTKKKEELSKILVSPNVIEGFEYLKKMQLLEVLNITYDNLKFVEDINGMYAQITLPDEFPFTKEEKENIEKIKDIISYGKIDCGILFKYDIYLCSVAGEILDIDKKEIYELYNEMPIKNIKQLQIDGNDIIKLLEVEPSKKVKEIIDVLVFLVLNKKIKNNKEDLTEYILKNKDKWLK